MCIFWGMWVFYLRLSLRLNVANSGSYCYLSCIVVKHYSEECIEENLQYVSKKAVRGTENAGEHPPLRFRYHVPLKVPAFF